MRDDDEPIGICDTSDEIPTDLLERFSSITYTEWKLLAIYTHKFLQVNNSLNCIQKHTKMFLPYRLQNEADSYKVWYMFSSLNLP